MFKPWHKKMKQLFSEASQDYVTWLLPEAQFNRIVSTELIKDPLSRINDAAILRRLIVKMSTVQTAEEALQYIRKVTGEAVK